MDFWKMMRKIKKRPIASSKIRKENGEITDKHQKYWLRRGNTFRNYTPRMNKQKMRKKKRIESKPKCWKPLKLGMIQI